VPWWYNSPHNFKKHFLISFFLLLLFSSKALKSYGVADMATMQVKSMDDQLYNALKIKAKADNRSLSQQVVMIIKEYLSNPGQKNQHQTNEFLKLAGSWKDDRSAEKIIQDIKNRRSKKRFDFMDNTDVFD
jgi:plasmid stability protein